jgi:hypothetical protein
MQAPPEKLGSFYLGAEYDLKTNKVKPNPINYDARDLTTHAICVGMTGSGKTGLCIGLLEEAALDKVPAILIDPKGDITNLLLQFPQLRAEDFLPWVNPDDARRKGSTNEEYSKATADTWRKGLADWGIGPDRIKSLSESADFCIYTPGSDSGLPVSILTSLTAPGVDFEANAEAIRERISGTASALLGLAGIDADPVRSREAILISTIFEYFWRKNEDLSLEKLIMSIQNPPVRQLGVFDVETFYPQKNRFELAMALNTLVAAPSFQSWLQGEPLDIDHMFFTDSGKPRHSIFYIAHLSDRERMFFVTLLLENLLAWVRRQTGTTSLRALLYFDEVFGFLPPVAEPPSKRPLMTLLKQARAFGTGIVLVTQNPVDIDYKGLTNAGTWLIGKLQAERDKERVLQGLRTAISEAGGTGTKVDYDSLVNQLTSRIFLMHNVNEDKPVVFSSRWAMSYLRGPMTKPQVAELMAPRKKATGVPKGQPGPTREKAAAGVSSTATGPRAEPAGFSKQRTVVDSSLAEVFLPIEVAQQKASSVLAEQLGKQVDVANAQLVYESGILGGASIHFSDRKMSVDQQVEKVLLARPTESVGGVKWEDAEAIPTQLKDMAKSPGEVNAEQGPYFAPVPEQANTAKKMEDTAKGFADWLYFNTRLSLKSHADLGVFQKPGENDRDFLIRLQQAARERRDAEVDKLQEKHSKSLDALRDKVQRLEMDLSGDQAEYEARKREEMVKAGETVLSFFVGRRPMRSISSMATKRRMTTKAGMDMEQTKSKVGELQKEMADLDGQLKQAVDEITQKWDEAQKSLTGQEVKPRRTDISIDLVALAWSPFWVLTYSDEGVSKKMAIPAYARTEGK